MNLSCNSLHETWLEACGTRWFLAEANKGHSAILVSVWEIETHRETKSFCEWKPKYWEQDTDSFERCSSNEEIERYMVRVWENEKEKGDIFLCSCYTHKEDKLVEFSWTFWVLQLWRVGVFKVRFATSFLVRLYFTPWDLICCVSNLLWTQV